jgi:hypothetical protein
MQKEKRKHPRIEMGWPITIQTAEGPMEAKLKNLAADGAYIYCKQTSDPDNFVPITINPPNHSPLKVTAKVLWADQGLSPGMGVRFVQMSEKDRHFLVKEVSDLLKSK